MIDIEHLVQSVGIPHAETVFKENKNSTPPPPPFLMWEASPITHHGSDDKIFYSRQTVKIELYTKKSHTDYENIIDKALENGVEYTKEHDYMSYEKLHVTTYQFTNICKI